MHTESFSFGVFLNLDISRILHLSEFFFKIHINNIKQTTGKQNYDETHFLFKLLNVVFFQKKVPIGKYDANFIF